MDIFDQLLAPPPMAGRFYGIVVAKVSSNIDLEGLGRVKVTYPWLSDADTSHWARLATPMAGKERGFFFIPEVGDEVLVAFEHGMIEFPYILGGLWNGVDKPPEVKNETTNRRTIKSTSGHLICLDDSDGAEKIEIIDKSNANSIIFDTVKNTITISADADITIKSAQGKLVLAGNGVEITSQADITLTATAKMGLKAGPELKIEGQMVKIN
ncbi:MAG: phage tail protein [Aestuariibacter sp.]|nr:phage tail protein [Aestuariibacter sp.]